MADSEGNGVEIEVFDPETLKTKKVVKPIAAVTSSAAASPSVESATIDAAEKQEELKRFQALKQAYSSLYDKNSALTLSFAKLCHFAKTACKEKEVKFTLIWSCDLVTQALERQIEDIKADNSRSSTFSEEQEKLVLFLFFVPFPALLQKNRRIGVRSSFLENRAPGNSKAERDH